MSEVKVYEVTPSVFYPEQRAFPLDMPPGRYVSVEDVDRLVREAWMDAATDLMDNQDYGLLPGMFDRSRTAARLRAMEGE